MSTTYKVVRFCCTSGQCCTCWPFPRNPFFRGDLKSHRVEIEQFRTDNRVRAEYVADAWSNYGGSVVEVN